VAASMALWLDFYLYPEPPDVWKHVVLICGGCYEKDAGCRS